jgi:ribosomal-protein-alanine N-acetyltransferase
MANGVQLIEAGMAYLPVLGALQQQAFADPAISGSAWSEQAIAGMLGMPGVATRLLQWDGQAMGMAMWRAAADEAELLTLGLLPQGRGRGLALRLMEDGLTLLDGWGVNSLFLEVSVSNSPAIALYRRCGFEIVGRRRNYYSHAGSNIDAHVMRAEISIWKQGIAQHKP